MQHDLTRSTEHMMAWMQLQITWEALKIDIDFQGLADFKFMNEVPWELHVSPHRWGLKCALHLHDEPVFW